MIIATAGHVDHGKTSLVRALTGVDTDRLEEEKRRGMSIDLGFAYADLGGGGPTGFVDVPGHERFVRNMLAGVAAIDFALVVVAADDGPMPQTLEHLAVLELLGVSRGAVALTKVDRVAPERLAQARQEIAAVLASGPLRVAPVFPLATPSGEGIAALREHLAAEERATVARSESGNFRLSVDRSFSVSGAGLVVTGAVFAGTARVGDLLMLSPRGTEVRVRAIHAQGRPADAARAGQRCAINLAGADLRKAEVGRGDWLVAPAAHAPSDRIDVRLEVLRSESRPLAHWTPVHLHLGAGACSARVALVGGRAIPPGEHGFAQLVLDAPVPALRGDRFVLRDASAQRSVGGGVVLDPFGQPRGRGRPAHLAELEAMRLPTPQAALQALLEAAPEGVRLDRFERAWNLTQDEAERLRAEVPMEVVAAGGAVLAIWPAHADALRERLLDALAGHHAAHPDSLGATLAELASGSGARRPTPATRAAVRSLLAQQRIVQEGPVLRLPAHRPRLAPEDEALLGRLSPLLSADGLRPPIVGEVAQALGMPRDVLLGSAERLARLGHLVRVAPNRFFLPATVAGLVDVAQALARESADGSFDAAVYRDRSGIGRNLTIQVLEFLDRSGVTRFARDRRWLADAGDPPC